jgi:hypothetical protein
MAASSAVSLRESNGIAPARGLPAAERRQIVAGWRLPHVAAMVTITKRKSAKP